MRRQKKPDVGKVSVPGHIPSAFHIYVLIAAGIIIIGRHNFSISRYQQFVYLAKSFLDGHLYFTSVPEGWGDTSYYLGHHYWPLGPLPAIILIPLVAVFGMTVRQGYLLFMFNMLNLFLLHKIARKITQNHVSALWLCTAYVFGTSYFSIALVPWSWYFGQVIANSFLLLALYEFFYERKWWLIGFYTALGTATRINIVLAAVFFFFPIVLGDEKKSRKVMCLAQLCIPVAVSVAMLMAYNFLRFGNILEFGYGLQILYDGHETANRAYGIWSLVHFPANLYYFLLNGPIGVFTPGTKVLAYPYLRADGWGMSILFTSPILLWIFKAPWKNSVVRLSVLTGLLMFIVFLGYYGIGFYQYGYRYALDFHPFLFVALAYAAEAEFSFPMKIMVLSSFLFNYYLMTVSGMMIS